MQTENLKKMRKEMGITQIEVAKRLNLSNKTYCTYETGTREPDNATLCQIADFFRVTTDYLLGRETLGAILIPKNILENEMLSLFRKLPAKDQYRFLGVLQTSTS